MKALEIKYDGQDFELDLEDLDMVQGRAMETMGVANLKELLEGIEAGDLSALTVAYWVMLQQNGEPGARLNRVVFKPMKFLRAVHEALAAELKRQEEEEGENPKED